MDKRLNMQKGRKLIRLVKVLRSLFLFMKGKMENGHDGSNRFYRNGETMMRTSGSME